MSGTRPPLTLDPIVVGIHQTAVDPVTCVHYIFALITLAKMANDSLISPELHCLPQTYLSAKANNLPQHLVLGSKLRVLLELGAAFLEAMAPTSSHPAKKHARMLRAILGTGEALLNDGDSSVPTSLTDQDQTPGQSGSRFAKLTCGAVAASSGSYTQGTQSVPPLESLSLHPQPSEPWIPQQGEPGDTLATLLGDLSPQWLAQFGYHDPNLGLETGMAVDWDSLKISMSSALRHQPDVPVQTLLGGGVSNVQ